MRFTFPRRNSFDFSSPASRAALPLLTPVVALLMIVSADCGGGGSQQNPPSPHVVIDVTHQFVDVGDRYFLDGSQSTDPNGDAADLTFDWRITDGGVVATAFDDHCVDNFDEICTSNTDDHCKNDVNRLCHKNSDCLNQSTCDLNSGTSSPDCSTGVCGLGEGPNGVKATFVANVAGPFTVRLTAKGSKSNGTKAKTLDTYPSLYVLDTLVEFGGTQGALIGAVKDALVYAPGASEGAADPKDGNLVVIDDTLGLVRVFNLLTGEIVGAFGESDSFVDGPTALAFEPVTNRLFVAQSDGKVLMFDDTTGILISSFGNVGAGPVAIHFSPVNGNLLVVYGTPGSGVHAFDANGNALGVLGNTATAADEAVDIDFVGDTNSLLIADQTGKVVRCNSNGTSCGQFSAQADTMLADGSPSAIAVNPSADFTTSDVMIADPIGKRVITCQSDGTNCETFGDTDGIDSQFEDVFFAPTSAPTTTTSTSTTTTTTLK